MIHDITNLNDQLIEKKMQMLKGKLSSKDQTGQTHFEFLQFDTLDPFFAAILGKVFDFVLITRRNFLKSLNKNQMQKIIDLILSSLQNLDKRAYELYSY
jgi:hypothetical protein